MIIQPEPLPANVLHWAHPQPLHHTARLTQPQASPDVSAEVQRLMDQWVPHETSPTKRAVIEHLIKRHLLTAQAEAI